MVNTCSAFGCNERFRKGSCVSFHCFPINKEIRAKWVVALRRENFTPTVHSRVCSKHFTEHDFDREKFGGRWLKPDAVPSIFAFPQHLMKKANLRKPPTSRASEKSVEELDEPGSSSQILQKENLNPSVDHTTISEPDDAGAETHERPNEEPSMEQNLNSQAAPRRRRKRPLRYLGDISPAEITSPTKAKKLLELAQNQCLSYKKEIKRLRARESRLKKRVQSLKALIGEIKSKYNMSDHACAALQVSMPTCVEKLLKRLEKEGSREKYPPELRSFALTLHFYSSKAYEYVRKTFNMSLPHPSTIRKWFSGVNGEPGITSEALCALKMKVEEANAKGNKVYAALIFDEMAIRRHIEWDGQKFSGYIDYGTNLDDDELPVAKEALTFMVNAINGNWKIPVGYHLIDGLTASEKANLVLQYLEELHLVGVEVMTLTFDGTSANIAMSSILGASINFSEVSTSFPHPVTGRDIRIMLDPCHMLKLIRNTLASKKVIIDESGGVIQWDYIVKLQELQSEEGLHAATKLRSEHINWFRQKMKVKIAAQTLSNSVATAMECLEEDLKLEGFVGCKPTVKFIRTINNVFDILNSRNLLARNFKSPVTERNFDSIVSYLDSAAAYIRGLRVSSVGPSILESNRRTGFLGFLVGIETVKKLAQHFFQSSALSFLLTYKMSQDHLETFFSAVRSRGGHNNNPTCRQFKAAYKRLLIHQSVRSSVHGNCTNMDNTGILSVPSQSAYRCNPHIMRMNSLVCRTNTVDDAVAQDHTYAQLPNVSRLSDYVQDVVAYVSGFVQKKILKTLKCDECRQGLLQNPEDDCTSLLKRRNMGGLTTPCKDIVNICRAVERAFREAQAAGKLRRKDIFHILTLEAFKGIASPFHILRDHILDQDFEENHINNLVRAIIYEYLSIRLYHVGKSIVSELKLNYSRSINTKTIHFKGH